MDFQDNPGQLRSLCPNTTSSGFLLTVLDYIAHQGHKLGTLFSILKVVDRVDGFAFTACLLLEFADWLLMNSVTLERQEEN
ncbi:hypothetical protein DPMN_181584 [Dreissena polymorpha]|uniref:Uncharacterized protein n=1 Tax=Dreissena polymorpha TaxID=45954 RepID=A0A9D4DED5_DREPO|nr:hypothetical protein DPMN_181584 [Dreissena polymorpha]